MIFSCVLLEVMSDQVCLTSDLSVTCHITTPVTIQKKMKIFIKDFFRKLDQILRKLRIWSHLLKKSLLENFIFCAVWVTCHITDLWADALDQDLFELCKYALINVQMGIQNVRQPLPSPMLLFVDSKHRCM